MKFSTIVTMLTSLIVILSIITINDINKKTEEFVSNQQITYLQDLQISAGASEAVSENVALNDITVEEVTDNITANSNDTDEADDTENEIEEDIHTVPQPEIIVEEIYGETTDRLNFRVEPTTESDVIMVLPKGAKLRLLQQHGEWYLANRNDIEGYIHGDYVTLTDDPVETLTVKIFPNEKCPAEIQHATKELSEKYGIPMEIMMAIEYCESNYNPNNVSKKDGRDHGICQIRDVNHGWLRKALGRYLDFYNYYDNIEAACYLIQDIRNDHPNASWEYILLEYNRGPKSARKWINDHGTASSDYTRKVLAKARELGFTGN
jgi:hypothetical protein